MTESSQRRTETGPTDEVHLLDCTLRDGGYYNDWDYSPAVVHRYVRAIAAARVPIAELGFRTAETGRYLGPTAYTTDRYLSSLDLPDTVSYGVMLNAKELVSATDPCALVDSLFAKRELSPVGLVRIASNFNELTRLEPAIERLRDLGYEIGVNLMQIASRADDEIEEFGALSTRWNASVAYFADSFGGMQPTDIRRVVGVLRTAFAGPIGCHTHDNMSLAFANSLAAIDAGATYVDATILGMGRGPGNARTEYLAFELNRRGVADLDVGPLLPVVTGDFTTMQRQFGWGSNVYYFLSAANGIHPTYVQEMTKDGRYTVDEIVTAVGQLTDGSGASYSQERMEAAATHIGLDAADGSDDVSGWCEGRDVLIVGPGPTGVERRDDIESFIRDVAPLVIALNAVPPVDRSLVDAYAICHPVRALIDAEIIATLDRPVFMPRSITARLDPPGPAVEFRDYGLTIAPDTFEAAPTTCRVPRIGSFPYALAFAYAGGARRVLLTGFDGFDHGDPRQDEMEETFRLFAQLDHQIPVVALTKTTYNIEHASLYAL